MKRKIALLFVTLFISITSFAQLEVKEGSFKEVAGFVNINTEKMYDDNEKPYAVLKIKTENINDKQRHELLFQGNAATFFEIEYKVGEVWVYLSYYATFIKISHPDLSSTEFWFPFDMEPKKGYEITLINRVNYTPTQDKPQNNYLIIKTDQQNAMIYLDDSFVGIKECSKLYNVGEKHRWKIECDLYYTEFGEIDIVSGDPIVVERTLHPSFGYINVKSSPENGAHVFVDGVKVGTTPCKSDRIKSGTHNVRVVKEMFDTSEQTVVVEDGKTSDVELKMTANYATVKVITESQSDIYVDNEYKGVGKWNGRLEVGEHIFEAKKQSHQISSINVKLSLGKNDDIEIPAPKPIYGSINVNTTPMGANISIDGKLLGTTPRIINDVLIGKHEIKLDKAGYTAWSNTIYLEEGKQYAINEKLKKETPKHNNESSYNKSSTQQSKPKTSKPKVKKYKYYDSYSIVSLDIGATLDKSFIFGTTMGEVKQQSGWFCAMGLYHNMGGYATLGLIYRITPPFAIKVAAGYKGNIFETHYFIVQAGIQYDLGDDVLLSFDVGQSNSFEVRMGIVFKNVL